MTKSWSATPFQLRLRTRWRDYDALQHVNSATYVTYLEEGRDAWLETVLGIPAGEHYVLAALNLDYKRSLTLDDREVVAEVTPVRVGKKSLTLHERLIDGQGRTVIDAQTVIVMWNPAGDPPASRELTTPERELLARAYPDQDSSLLSNIR